MPQERIGLATPYWRPAESGRTLKFNVAGIGDFDTLADALSEGRSDSIAPLVAALDQKILACPFPSIRAELRKDRAKLNRKMQAYRKDPTC